MSAFQIGEVRYQNFGPFGDVSIDFARPGLTVIDGQIVGSFGCDSNGAGKSFLFDGVAWALFGRCLRERYTADDIRRHTWDDAQRRNTVAKSDWTCVTVHLVGGEYPVRIERYRKHPVYKDHVRLFIDGTDRTRGTTPETTDAIASNIGMDFNAFCNSVAFAAREDIKSFLSQGASDGDRKKVLEKILGLELYAAAQKVARRRLKEMAEQLTAFRESKTRLVTQLAEREAALADLLPADELEDLELNATMLKATIGQKQRAYERKKQQRSYRQAERNSEESRLTVRMNKYDRATEDYESKASELRQTIRARETEAAEHNGMRQPFERQREQILKLDGEACPTCKRELSKAETKKLLKKLDEAAGQHVVTCAFALKEGESAQKKLDRLSRPTKPEPTGESRALDLEIAKIEAEMTGVLLDIKVAKARLTEVADRLDQATGQAKRLRTDVKETQGGLQILQDSLTDATLKAEMLEFWVDGFGNRGLKSFLIEAETPHLNKLATRTAQRLLGPGTRIALHATKQLKTKKTQKEEITIDAIIPGRTNNYAGASRAQKKRLDLALILAFREIVAGRAVKGFQQLFADEIFDGMDASGVESCGDLLKELARECPVAVISHDPAIRKLADHYATVYHSGDTATLRTGASQPSKKRVAKNSGNKRKSKR